MSNEDKEKKIKLDTLKEMSGLFDHNVQAAYVLAELRILNHKIERLIEMQPE